MSDEQILDLLDRMDGAPQLVLRRQKFVYMDGLIVEFRRVGFGPRWAFSPSRDVHRALPAWYPREARLWAETAARVNFSAYLRGMAARVL